MGLEYDGSAFLGWQVQRQQPTIQGTVEQALARVADHDLRVTVCGRTDTGVHALCQVAHFDTEARRSERSWVLGVNSHLPASLSVLWVREVDESFHARFSAFARTYRYVILNRWIRPALHARYVAWCRQPLDAGRMHEAAQCLLGEHDFSAFRAAGCQARHAVRDLQRIEVRRAGSRVEFEVTANGFLYHMVRNLAGSLMAVGRGERDADWLSAVLAGRDRNQAAPTAPSEGLYFVGARFPTEYGLPPGEVEFPRGTDGS
ncbi:tRNA pseudouridine(38-40) synthase TruA [Elongatibacter sediminis]|uniref:tRNA pseudouridine synthase A n=1 Tax=Elongatibacter sediminis TaxID=3119006 RepID=A0AAW9RAE1_9GAMM